MRLPVAVPRERTAPRNFRTEDAKRIFERKRLGEHLAATFFLTLGVKAALRQWCMAEFCFRRWLGVNNPPYHLAKIVLSDVPRQAFWRQVVVAAVLIPKSCVATEAAAASSRAGFYA